MHHQVTIAFAMLLFTVPSAIAQKVSRAYCGDDGKAHLVYGKGAVKTVPPQRQQVGCENISVAADGHTVAWSALVENCCTSYPIPIAVVVSRDGKKAVISPGQMIWQWHFVGRGDRVAVLSGPVHGFAAAAGLYDAHSGKVLTSWNGTGASPEWAEGWEGEFAEPEP